MIVRPFELALHSIEFYGIYNTCCGVNAQFAPRGTAARYRREQRGRFQHAISNCAAVSDTRNGVAMGAKKRRATNLSGTLICRCPEALADAIERAAASELISKAAYARRAVMTALQRDGFLNNQQRAS
jgi:hypothetical protein